MSNDPDPQASGPDFDVSGFLAVAEPMAVMLRAYYVALVGAGFTEDQALVMVTHYMESVVGASKK